MAAGQVGEGGDIFGNKVVMAVVKDIYSSVSFGSEKLKAVMNLPPVSQVDNETLSLALQFILEKYFHLDFPSQEMMHVRAGRSVKFAEEKSMEKSLPVRQVAILLSPEHRSFEVSGVAAEHGKDGYSELLFNWRTQPGQVDSQGNIDLKRLNTYPNVLAEQPLATIYLRSEGNPGVNCHGKKIKQRMGQPLKVKFNEVVIYQRDDPKDSSKYQLIARKGGIVDCIFSRKNDPHALARIDILDTITINSDVNYAVGDQGSLTNKSLECTSNIVVKKNVLGVFSMQSTGYIHIAGAFEGKKAVAEEIMVETITSGSKVIARRDVVASSMINAWVEGQTITLKKNANESKLIASELIRLLEKANCLALTMHTPRLESAKNRFAGRTTLFLGEELFNREKELLANLKIGEEEISGNLPELKGAASAIVQALGRVESSVKATGVFQHGEVVKHFAEIKRTLVSAIQNMSQPLNEKLIPSCYNLQAVLGEKKVHESILRKIETFISSLKKFNELLEIQREKVEAINKIKTELPALKEAAGNLAADFQSPTFFGNNAEIRVACGESELLLNAESVPAGDFSVVYRIKEGAEGIGKGSLKIEADTSGNF